MGHVLGGSFLIAGTTIGVGMLAMPVATAPGGFFPSILIYLACWLFMLTTGLLLLEVCMWMPKDSNMITMVHTLLGNKGKWVCWAVYLFLFLAVITAHVAGGGSIVNEMTFGKLSVSTSAIIYVLVFAPVVYLGAHSVDRLNLILMAGLILTYLGFIAIAAPSVNFDLLKRGDWSKAWLAIPVMLTAFTYQVIVPTLVTYMERNVRKVRLAIICGSLIPLVIYLVWQYLILGIVPLEGKEGLLRARELGQSAVIPLKYYLDSPMIFSIGKYFAFFAMTVSHIAISLAFVDFLADGFHIKKTHVNKFWLLCAVFIPPTIVALTYPHIFIRALRYAGGISIAILFGLFPPLMVWIGRYKRGFEEIPNRLPVGKTVLLFLIVLICIEMLFEVLKQFIDFC